MNYLFDEKLATHIRHPLTRKRGVKGKMMGGVCKGSLIDRLGPDNSDDALGEPHDREFDIAGEPMRNWVRVEPEGVEDDDQLKAWIDRATKFVRTLPKKV